MASLTQIRCPFCRSEQNLAGALAPGGHKIICDACHRAFLAVVKKFLGLWKTITVRII
jgi:hypothetical protein